MAIAFDLESDRNLNLSYHLIYLNGARRPSVQASFTDGMALIEPI
jgi:hypothetical protein